MAVIDREECGTISAGSRNCRVGEAAATEDAVFNAPAVAATLTPLPSVVVLLWVVPTQGDVGLEEEVDREVDSVESAEEDDEEEEEEEAVEAVAEEPATLGAGREYTPMTYTGFP